MQNLVKNILSNPQFRLTICMNFNNDNEFTVLSFAASEYIFLHYNTNKCTWISPDLKTLSD